MYRDFFGFRDDPFRMTPDTRYLFESSRHQEAISALLYGIGERKGFIVISGEIGTGKTTLVRALLNRLDPKVRTAVILNPRLSETELLHAILDDLGVEVEEKSPTQKQLLDRLNAFLLDCSARGENVAVIVDEAQNLEAEVLEAIRLLSNLETEQEKLIQIILVGQPELNEILRLPRLEQLRSRIAVRYHITPLEPDEVPTYVRHRLRVAGNEHAVTFTDAAMKRLVEYSRGVPRLINVICDKCLLAAYVLEKREVDESIVEQAIRDHEGPQVEFPTTGAAGMLATGASRAGAAARGNGAAANMTWRFAWGAAAALAILAVSVWYAKNETPAAPDSTAEDRSQTSHAAASTLDEPRAAVLRKLLAAWRPELEGEILSTADPEALARGLGLVPRTLRVNIASIEAVDLPAILPVARAGRTAYVALLGVGARTYTLYDPAVGLRTIPRNPATRDPRPYPGAVLLVPDDPVLGSNLSAGDAGPRVARLQGLLRAVGETVDDPEGRFGVSTARAVRNFQARTGVVEDGVAGPVTTAALLARATDGAPRLSSP